MELPEGRYPVSFAQPRCLDDRRTGMRPTVTVPSRNTSGAAKEEGTFSRPLLLVDGAR